MDDQQQVPPPPLPPPPPRRMSPLLSAALWILGTVLLVGFAVVSAAGEDDGARFAGALMAALLIPLGIAALIRWGVTRNNPDERAWSPWLVLIAAGFALLFALPRIDEAGTESRKLAECRESTSLGARFESLPMGMAAETLDAETEAQLSEAVSRAREDLKFEARRIVRGAEDVGVAIVIVVRDDDHARQEFTRGLTERAGEQGAGPPYQVNVGPATGGTQVNLKTPNGDAVIVVGFTGCHAITAIAPVGGDANRIVSAMAEAPDS